MPLAGTPPLLLPPRKPRKRRVGVGGKKVRYATNERWDAAHSSCDSLKRSTALRARCTRCLTGRWKPDVLRPGPALYGCEGLWSEDYGYAWNEYPPPPEFLSDVCVFCHISRALWNCCTGRKIAWGSSSVCLFVWSDLCKDLICVMIWAVSHPTLGLQHQSLSSSREELSISSEKWLPRH